MRLDEEPAVVEADVGYAVSGTVDFRLGEPGAVEAVLRSHSAGEDLSAQSLGKRRVSNTQCMQKCQQDRRPQSCR